MSEDINKNINNSVFVYLLKALCTEVHIYVKKILSVSTKNKAMQILMKVP